MSLITDLWFITKDTGKRSIKSLIKHFPIMFTGFIYSSILILISFILPFFWILSGIIMLILSSALISNYLYLLNCIIEYDRLTLKDFKEGFLIYLRKIWTVLFIGIVVSLGLDLFVRPILAGAFGPVAYNLILNFMLVILFNALPETIYQKSYHPWESIKYSVEFIREHWVEWYLPNTILIGGLILITGDVITGIFTTDISIGIIFNRPFGLVVYLIGQLWFSFMMIYRGYLYKLLNTSSRRKRLFMREV